MASNDLMDMSLSKLLELVMDREILSIRISMIHGSGFPEPHAAVHGVPHKGNTQSLYRKIF